MRRSYRSIRLGLSVAVADADAVAFIAVSADSN